MSGNNNPFNRDNNSLLGNSSSNNPFGKPSIQHNSSSSNMYTVFGSGSNGGKEKEAELNSKGLNLKQQQKSNIFSSNHTFPSNNNLAQGTSALGFNK